jgi:hypothetical protein
MFSSAFCAEGCRKDFLKAVKAEPRRAAGRGISTERVTEGEQGKYEEGWRFPETPV